MEVFLQTHTWPGQRPQIVFWPLDPKEGWHSWRIVPGGELLLLLLPLRKMAAALEGLKLQQLEGLHWTGKARLGLVLPKGSASPREKKEVG